MDFKKVKRCPVTMFGNGIFCGTAVLARWGIKSENRPMRPIDMMRYMDRAGMTGRYSDVLNTVWIQDKLTNSTLVDRPDSKIRPTVTQFLKFVESHEDFKDKDVIFFTPEHVMCYKEGVLTDTERKAGGRRRVWHYITVDK